MAISRDMYNTLFQSRGTSIADVRNLELIEPFPLPSDGPKVVTPPAGPVVRRGDVDGDSEVTINDPVRLLNFLFNGKRRPTCADAADSNDDGEIDLVDSVFSLNWLFQGRRAPPAPGGLRCGRDPTPDRFRQCEYDAGSCE